MVSNSIQDLSSNLMRASNVLYSLVLLTFLAALLSEYCHHSGCIDVFHTHNLECLSCQLLIFTLREERIKVLDLANDNLRGQLLILEMLYEHRFIEGICLNHYVVGLLSLNEKAIFGYLKKRLNKVFGYLQGFRMSFLEFSDSVNILQLVFEL